MTVGQYVTTSGLLIPSVQDILDMLTTEQRRDIDPNLDTSPESPQGQLNGLFASHWREGWEAVALAFAGNDPDAAEFVYLDWIAKLTGTTRAAATPSTFRGPRRVKLSLNANTSVPAGSLMSQAGNPSVVFRLTENVGGSTITAGDYFGAAECTQLGPIACAAATLTVIQTPVVGWTAVTNPTDAVLGNLQDTDAQLRVRRLAELALGEGGSTAAIRAALLAYTTDDLVHPIESAIVSENTTDFFDSAGRPPHSTEALVYDGIVPAVSNDTIAQVIWANRGGGIQSYGTDSGTAIDYLQLSRVVYFSRALIQEMKITQTIVYGAAGVVPDTAQIKQVLVDRFESLSKLGDTLCAWDIFTTAVKDSVPNALRTTSIQLGNVGAALLTTFANLPIAARTKLHLDTTNITIALTPGSP